MSYAPRERLMFAPRMGVYVPPPTSLYTRPVALVGNKPTVSNIVDLYTAMDNANPGDRIPVAPGNYGDFYPMRTYADYVYICAADPTNKPVFTAIKAANATSQYVGLDSLKIDATGLIASYDVALEIKDGAHHFKITNMDIRGRAAGTNGDVWNWGFLVNLTNGAHNIDFGWNELQQASQGLQIATVSNLNVYHNLIHNMHNQGGWKFVETQTAAFYRNIMYDFNAAIASHWDPSQGRNPDGATRATTDVDIYENYAEQGNTQVAISQGYTMTDNNNAHTYRAQRVKIRNNIGCGDCDQWAFGQNVDDLEITGNDFYYVPLDPSITPKASKSEMLIQGCTGTWGNNGVSSADESRYNQDTPQQVGGMVKLSSQRILAPISAVDAAVMRNSLTRLYGIAA